MNKIFVNLGLPRTSSTNLQRNFYPKLNEFNYIGKYAGEEDKDYIFLSIQDYIQNTQNIIKNKNDINNLKINFTDYCKKSRKNILISNEFWFSSYQNNIRKNKHIVFSHWEKLKRLNNLIKSTNLKSKYFIIFRNPKVAIPSLFATMNTMIIDIFGWNFRDINYFLKEMLDKNNKFEELNLLFDTYNLKKAKNFFLEELNNEIHVIDYDLISTNKEEFLKNLFSILEIKANYLLIKNLDININVARRNDRNQYIVHLSHQSKIYRILLEIIKTLRLRNFIKFFFIFFGFKNFKKREYIIEPNQSLLNQAIELNEKT